MRALVDEVRARLGGGACVVATGCRTRVWRVLGHGLDGRPDAVDLE